MPSDAARIARALQTIADQPESPPSLEDLAKQAGVSSCHFQRLFSRWVGVSPKRFAQFLSLEHAKAALRKGATVLEATGEAHLSSPGRLHDLALSLEAVTPGEISRMGNSLLIQWASLPSPFGPAFLAQTPRGLCFLAFHPDAQDPSDPLAQLTRRWPEATLEENPQALQPLNEKLWTSGEASQRAQRLVVRGSNLQVRVWEALLKLPEGGLTSYANLAEKCGHPRAVRAVANAVGANPISWLIPCHRVLRTGGALGGYRWGLDRKRLMLAWERTHTVNQV